MRVLGGVQHCHHCCRPTVWGAASTVVCSVCTLLVRAVLCAGMRVWHLAALWQIVAPKWFL
jgi:hypothetical protein